MDIKSLLGPIRKYFHFVKEDRDLKELQQNLGYRFNDVSLLKQALTHKSFANEQQHENSFGNERLEFLGDAVLELIISHILMSRFKNCSEGKLSIMRAAIVNGDALSSLTRKLDVGQYILLSRGEEESKGRHKKSIQANVYEALIAAVYYDGGFREVFNMVENHCAFLVNDVARKGFFKDYKSRLQEFSQRSFSAVPKYALVVASGPDHKKVFDVQVVINGVCHEKGQGSNKKEAEQEAAAKTLKKLQVS